MRTWVKVSIGSAILVLLAFFFVAGAGSYYFFRHLTTGEASESAVLREMDVLRERFGARQPLIEVVDPRTADIRINRTAEAGGRPVSTIHVLTWSADAGTRLQTEAPLWLLRFSSVNILSQLGVTPERFRLTVADIRRYGPGIVVDYRRPGQDHVMIWVD
jgi:hypothetical protein